MSRIGLSVPGRVAAIPVVRLVVGGACARFELSFERVEELQLAVEAVLGSIVDARAAGPPERCGRVEVEIELGSSGVRVELGPLEVAHTEPQTHLRASGSEAVDALLERLVDRAGLVERDGGRWVSLEQGIPRA